MVKARLSVKLVGGEPMVFKGEQQHFFVDVFFWAGFLKIRKSSIFSKEKVMMFFSFKVEF